MNELKEMFRFSSKEWLAAAGSVVGFIAYLLLADYVAGLLGELCS